MTSVHEEKGGQRFHPSQPYVKTVTQQPATGVLNRGCVYPNYPKNASVGLGLTQIILAVMLIITQSVAIAVVTNRTKSGTAYYNVPCIIIAGALGIAAKSQRKFVISATMVMSIVAVSGACSILVQAAMGASEDAKGVHHVRIESTDHRVVSGEMRVPGFTCNLIMVLLAAAEIFVGIAQSVICIRHICCCQRDQANCQWRCGGGVLMTQPGAQPGPAIFQLQNEEGAVTQSPTPRNGQYTGQ